jgi:isoamylase
MALKERPDDEEILKIRQQQQRNLLTTLMLSQGVPMLVAGDEIGRTQQGNNNAYCQDNDISWLDWQRVDQGLLEFTRELISLRKQHPVFCRRKWFQGEHIKDCGLKEINWFLPEGTEMEEHNWNQDYAKSLAVFLNGNGIRWAGPMGERIIDDSFYLIFNAHNGPLDYKLPNEQYGKKWRMVLSTHCKDAGKQFGPGELVHAPGRSVVVLSTF